MKTKINNFLQSNVFILSIALLLAFLCHTFVTTEILASDKKEKKIDFPSFVDEIKRS